MWKGNCEKEILLSVATPEQWDCWLTLKADANASYKITDWHVKELIKFEEKHEGICCLFCLAYKVVLKPSTKYTREVFQLDCLECFGITGAPCLTIEPYERVDKAIKRLEEAGIWD